MTVAWLFPGGERGAVGEGLGLGWGKAGGQGGWTEQPVAVCVAGNGQMGEAGWDDDALLQLQWLSAACH